MSDYVDLAFFTCVCRGVKFYNAGIGDRLAPLSSRLVFKREPENVHDQNAVLVYVVGLEGELTALGYVAKEAACWLSPLLLDLGPYVVSG